MKKSERIFYESSSQLPLPRELSTPEKSGIQPSLRIRDTSWRIKILGQTSN